MIKAIVIAIAVIIVFLLAVNIVKNRNNNPTPVSDYPVVVGPYKRINIIGEISNKGVFDPTVEYNSNGSVGYLVYSGLEQPQENINSFHIKYIHTHLAKSTDNGKTWRFVKRITESIPGSVKSPLFAKIHKFNDDSIEGMWHNEVPTLVYVPEDKGKEWKLFWHKYFSADMPVGKKRPRIFSHSWIMYKEAASPEKLDIAPEIKLFSTNTAVTAARYNFQEFTGGQSNISTYTEPGSLYWNKKLYVALSYFTKGGKSAHKLILVSSSDHKTWDYIGIVLDKRDAFGDYINFWGAALAEEDGRIFLLISPIHKRKGYQGTMVFEFEDIDKGKLQRDKNGRIVITKYIKRGLPGKLNSGQSDYHKHNTYGGIIMPQADLDSFPKIGQIFSTKQKIVD